MKPTNFIRTCFQPDYIQNHSTTVRSPKSSSFNHLVDGSESSMLDISGSLEMSMSISAASVVGKAQVDYNSLNRKASRTSHVKQVIEEFSDNMDITNVQEDDLYCSEDTKFTHVVTKVTRGKKFEGTLQLTSNKSDNSAEAQGKLQVTILNIPIGGTGDIHYNSKDVKENYQFDSELKTSGGNFATSVKDVDEYVGEINRWQLKARDEEDKDINTMPISYELTPISTLKRFGNRIIDRSIEQQMLLSRAKPIINELNIFLSAVNYLKKKAPTSEWVNLTNITDDLEDKIQALTLAGLNGTITQDMINEYRQSRLAFWLASDYYKELKKKIDKEADIIREGSFFVKFDNKYLTPKKALFIEISNRDQNEDGSAHGVCTAKYGDGSIHTGGFGAKSDFRCSLSFLSNGSNEFNDRYITFPKESCRKEDYFPTDNFDVVSTSYEQNGENSQIHFENKFMLGDQDFDCNGYHQINGACVNSQFPLFFL